MRYNNNRIGLSKRIEIFQKALKDRDFMDMYMMSLLPKSYKKLETLGIRLKKDQLLRSLHTDYDNRHFMVFFIDGINNETYACIWEAKKVFSRWSGAEICKGIWRGYVNTEEILY